MKYLGSSGLTRLVELINERFATKTELNGKANSTHEHSYAGSSMAGGAATSANKINTDAGSATQPVYFDDGVPVATTYALNATVPAGAKFTDTTYENATTSEAGLMSAADKTIVNGIATTYAPLSSPVFTGTPVAPTPTTGDDSTKIATTAFVNDAISNIPSSTEWDDIVNKPSTFEPATHTHNYAASSTAGGSALSAEKINANAGSPSQPIYFNNGIPVATTYALNKTVPADAVFTDTTVGSDITLTGYSKPALTSAIAAADTVNQAIGKLEKALDGKPDTNEFTVFTEAEIYTLFGVPMPVTVTIEQSEHQTIHVTVDGTDHTETFTASIGAEYTVTVVPNEGYTAGTVTNASGTLAEDITISATEATLQTFTLTLAATENQTITLTYTEPNKSAQTITSTSTAQTVTVDYGTTWTATVTAAEGYVAGTLSASSGTVTAAITVSATAAKAIIVLTDSYYKMSDVYPNTYRSMTEVPDILDSSNITTTEEMFRGCTALTVSPELDTLNVGNMNRMFYECTNLTTVSQMDTSNVNYMDWMFYNCSSLPEEFSWAIDFDSIHGSVQNMFKGSSVTSVALANVDNTVKAIHITSEKLKGDNTLTINFVSIPNYHIGSIYPDTYRSMTSVDINTIKTQYPGILDNLTSVAHMFYNCVALTTISNINQLDISKVTNMKSMFHLCRALTSVPQLDTSDVTNMESMFHTCNALTSVPQLDTSNVTNMAYMFFDCQSLPSTFPWTIDCSSITDAYNMNGMFVYSPVTSVTLSNVNSSIRSGVTPERLKDSSLTITFV